jgi:flagellar hook-associated protein 2
VSVDKDPKALGDKLQAVVDAYNAVVSKIHTVAGHGSTTASNPVLRGDSSLRGVTRQLSSTLTTAVGSGTYRTLASLGLKLNNTGSLSLDRTALDKALSTDPDAVSKVLAGTDGSDGVMDFIGTLVTTLTDPTSGSLQARKDGLESRAKSLDDRVTREEARISRYSEQLRKQFTAMDSTVAGYNDQLSYLFSITG